ncbi:MAG: prepilin-type N-terminal cleavage/methylation domain-containing protein [bacterium]|nr:prepilin-type N-terminal cleavage/methylation domain-containing protein [bacterium]
MRRGGNAGYSLVELVAALTIFSLAVVGVMELFSTCLRTTSASMGYTQAVYLAQAMLEEHIVEDSLYPGSDSGECGESFPGHTWEMEVEEMDQQQGLVRVELTVMWTERGREHEYTLATMIAERDTL